MTYALFALLAVHGVLLGWSAVVHSPTIDEVQWLPGGVAHWKTGRLDLVTNHPPLVRLIAAIPLLFTDADTSSFHPPSGSRSTGIEFVRRNGARSFWLFTLGRWACIPFSMLGAVACFVWARDLYGPKSGLLAAGLWCFSPNILANGQLVSQDVPASSLGLIACYLFWRWLRQSTWTSGLWAGVGLGLALLTKMTMLINLALWPLLWLAWTVSQRNVEGGFRRWSRQALQLAAILVLAIDVLNVGYLFQDSFARLDSYSFRSQALGGVLEGPGNRFAGSLFGAFPVPFPRAFLEGVDFQRFTFEGGLPYQVSYLRGEWSTRGWPYYYLYALAIKVPLGTWCLAVLSLVFRLRSIDGLHRGRDEIVLLAPAATLLLIASTSLAWTDHLRHILPCFPVAFVWLSRVANMNWTKHRLMAATVTIAMSGSVLSSLWVYPHSLSYFNELVGGPRNGHYHLLSSNIDFGQDLLKLRQWYDAHPQARPLGLAYWDMDSVDPRAAGIEYFVPPSGPAPGQAVDTPAAQILGPQPGWYAVNVNLLHGDAWPGRSAFPRLGYYGYFLNFTPVARAGYSIYIYHITADDANRVRHKMGLLAIEAPR